MHHSARWLTRHPSSLYGVVDSSTTSGRTDQKEHDMTATTTSTDFSTLTGTYALDTAHSRIGFVARHAMVTKVRGSFNEFEGATTIDGTNPENSTVSVTLKVESIDTRNAPTQFALGLAAKDAGLIVETGRALGVPTPAGAAVLQVLVGAIAGGLGDHDWGDLVAAAERQGDVELKWAQ